MLNLFHSGKNGTVSVTGNKGRYHCVFMRPANWAEKDVRRRFKTTDAANKFFAKYSGKIKDYE